jgi:hypothetical protein
MSTNFTRNLIVGTLACAFVAISTAAASAQATPAPVPAAPRHQTVVSEQYDGNTHMTLSPYVWLPTINGQFQYPVLRPPHEGPGSGDATAIVNTRVGPNSYLQHINFAAMGAFELHKGNFGIVADLIDLNLSNGASAVTSVSGPFGKLQVPVDVGTSGRLQSDIWEIAGTGTLWHNDNADVQALIGWRQAAINGTLNWNLNIGKNSLISRSGTITKNDSVGDAIVGLRGKIAFGDGRWFIPYYADYGAGTPSNSTWEAYAGIGRATKGGSFLLLFRELNYNFTTGSSFIQNLRLGGPLVGYSFKV